MDPVRGYFDFNIVLQNEIVSDLYFGIKLCVKTSNGVDVFSVI